MAEPIIINEWNKGIAKSPIVGFGDMRQVDVFTRPGSVRIEKKATKESGTTITGRPLWSATNKGGEHYVLDDDGKLYTSTDDGDSWTLISGNTLPSAGAGGQGMAIWKHHVFVATTNSIEVYDIAGAAWSTSWLSITAVGTGQFHPFHVGQDDILYFGNDSTIGTVQEDTDFDPDVASTYTTNTNALDLPEDYRVKCLAPLGKFLMIGTTYGTDPTDLRVADIFPWDRVSSSFNKRISFDEFGIHQMLNVGSRLYVNAGLDGRLFVTDGLNKELYAEIPEIATGSATIINNPDALKLYRGNILWGVSYNGGTVTKIGVYEIRDGVLVMKNLISTGNDSTSGTVKIGTILPKNNIYLLGWEDTNATEQGMDAVHFSQHLTTNYGAIVESPIYRVGNTRRKRSFDTLEIILDEPLTNNQGVRVKYRDDLAASWTTIATIDHDTYGAISEYAVDASIPELVNIQLRIELTTGSATTNNVSLREVILS